MQQSVMAVCVHLRERHFEASDSIPQDHDECCGHTRLAAETYWLNNTSFADDANTVARYVFVQ